ncbi:hypothetical protein EV368DRAFT_51505 [Lentinula lateritia]|nr:hypothetical protein EV368DRAFT_51505 [Lentinula lateritia]
MVFLRGPNRASAMWGSSTHNTKIERLWPEVGSQFAHCQKFVSTWNSHPISGHGHYQTPNVSKL